ncbi:MAG: HNH endonuclease, partial [Acidothermaceae bacterium]
MAFALVLNATYEPIGVVPGRRALLLVLASKATAVEDGEIVLHSETA